MKSLDTLYPDVHVHIPVHFLITTTLL